MRQSKVLIVLCTGFLVLSFCGCEKFYEMFPKFRPVSQKKDIPVQVPITGTVIAKVNGMPITLEQLEQEIENINQIVEAPEDRITTRQQKLVYLDQELIPRYLFYQEAKARGLDKQPQAQELLRNVAINLLATQLLQKEMESLVPTSSEIEDFYNLNKEYLMQEEERRIREIMVSSEVEAKEILIELLKGQDFASLATQRSRARSASAGGDLGFIKRGSRGLDFTRFDEVAFSSSLKVGDISNVFKDKDGFYIVKIEKIRGGQPKSLSEVWDEMKANVLFLKQQQRLQELSSQLLKKANIVTYKDRIQ